jgi:hypothetical protein
VMQTSVSDSLGAFSFTFTPAVSGVKTYRVIADAFGGRVAGASPSVQLTVD